MYDVVIVGSGLGGLQCAHLLAQQGLKVAVLEQHAVIGGSMQSYRRGTHVFDTGFHYIGGIAPGQSLYEPFKQLNLLHLPWYRMDKCYEHIHINGKTYRYAQGFDDFVETLAADFPNERKGLQRYARLLSNSANDHSQHDNFDQLCGVPALNYLRHNISDPTLIDVLCTPAAVKGEMNRDTLPLFSLIHTNSGCVESAWRLRGPGSLIAESLKNDILQMGGEIFTRAKVVEFAVEDGKVSHARTEDGRTFAAQCFVSDAHPAITLQLIAGKMGIFARRISSLVNTDGMLTISIELEPNTFPYFNHNEYVVCDGRTLLISCRPPQDGSPYIDHIDLLTLIPQDADIQQETSRSIAIAATVFPQLNNLAQNSQNSQKKNLNSQLSTLKTHVSTPDTWEHYTLTPGGSAFGIRKDWTNPMMTFFTPRTPISNLFLTGQSLIMHGVQGVTMTAFATCQYLNDYLKNG